MNAPGNFEHDPEVQDLLEPYIFEAVVRRKGSISAEHGLDWCKNEYMCQYASNPTAVTDMKFVKEMFDLNGILNSGKFLPNDNDNEWLEK